MSNAGRKTAIVLHAPPAVGKTEIWKRIKERFLEASNISLDDGWGTGEGRYNGGDGRYADLAQAKSAILVVELGWGEPAGLASYGATRNAGEWVGVLQAAGRSIFPFLLWADYPDAVCRLRHRQAARRQPFSRVLEGVGVRAMYENKDPLFTFPSIADFTEVRINTTNRPYKDVAEEIMGIAGLLGG